MDDLGVKSLALDKTTYMQEVKILREIIVSLTILGQSGGLNLCWVLTAFA